MKVWQLALVVEVVALAVAAGMALIPEPGTARTFAHFFIEDPSVPIQIGIGWAVLSFIVSFLVIGVFVVLRLRSRGASSR